MCDCGQGVQDESHVVFECQRTAAIREKYRISDVTYENLGDLMENHDVPQLVNFIYDCLKQF